MADLLDSLQPYSKLTPSQALDGLKKLMNVAPESQEVVDGWPAVNTPPSFRPYPEVIGGPELHKSVRDALAIAPELQGQVKSIGYPPTTGVFTDMRRSGIPEQDYANTNLMGSTDRFGGSNRRVYINPHLAYPASTHISTESMGKNIFGGPSWIDNSTNEVDDELPTTVIHELSHIAGNGERGAEAAEELWHRSKQPLIPPTSKPDSLQGLVDALKAKGINATLDPLGK